MSHPQARPQPLPAPKRERIQEIARRVRRDATTSPERYLKDTEVAHGGE